MSAVLVALIAAVSAAGSNPTGVVEGKVTFQEKSLFGEKQVAGDAAVVYLEHVEEPAPPAPAEHPKMVQKDKTFVPRLLVVTEGTEVDFPNDDLVFHNVFSLSRGNEFDLGVFRRGSSKTVRFSKSGVVDVFCNIHPEMIASILVLQNRHFAQVGPDGRYRLEAPPGKYTLVAYWARGAEERKEIELGGTPVTADFTLVDSGRTTRHLNKFGQQYGRYK